MPTFLLVVAMLADGALAARLVGVSGFLFWTGPESAHAGNVAAAAYIAAVIGCLAAPVVGFHFKRRAKAAVGLAVAWLPIAAAIVAVIIPAPY